MKRKPLDDADCPIARALDAVGDWWSLLIVRDAMLGARRFGAFQESLAISRNILTQRLRALVEHGVLQLTPASDGGAFMEYTLTQKGRDLFPVIVALRQWGEKHLFGREVCPTQLVDRGGGQPVRPLRVQAQSGRPLEITDTELKLMRRARRS